MDFGFPDGLDHVGLDSFEKTGIFLFLEREGPQQRLVEKVFIIAVWNRFVFQKRFVFLIDPTPFSDVTFPLVRYFREDIDARADILAPFGVVGGGRVQRMRPESGSRLIEFVELFQGDAESARVAAHLVEREEPAVDVKRRVLEALGHQGAGELLKPHDEVNPPPFFLLGQVVAGVQQEKSLDKLEFVEKAGIHFLRLPHHLRNAPAVDFAEGLLADVAPIDREKGQHLDQGPLETIEGDIAAESVPAGNVFQ